MSLSGLRNTKGSVLVCVTANPKGFPDCSKDASARKLKVPAGQAALISVGGLKPGTYAVAVIHDENSNGKMDMMLMPREGFGFSRNPKIRFGPPKFASASFAVGAGEVHQAIKLSYFL